jgi:cytochrome b
MNTTSAYRAEAPADAAATRRILVWDAPVRAFHWLMVASFFGAYVTAESERWRLVHVTLGYTVAGLVAFRILWGLVGTRHARFASFVRGPATVARYLGSLAHRDPERHIGHNPAGALAIVGLLALSAVVVAFGWAAYNELGGEWIEEAHEVAANLMLAMVGVHVAGVIVSSRLHRENLVAAMVDGRKAGRPQDGVRRAWKSVAALMLAAVLGFWWLQWRDAPAHAPVPRAHAATPHDQDQD